MVLCSQTTTRLENLSMKYFPEIFYLDTELLFQSHAQRYELDSH